MNNFAIRRQKLQESSLQPIDRHLAETDETDGSIYINAGIDSTCCKKQGKTIHELTDNIILPSSQIQIVTKGASNESNNEFSSKVNGDGLHEDPIDTIDIQSCPCCGK